MRISFGPFQFDRQSRLLWREGTEVALPPRVLGVLELLLDRAGQVVARQDLLDAVWKDAFVTDTSLAEAVSFLRQALGDDPQSPRYIQTVHRRGYRFVAPILGSDPGSARCRGEWCQSCFCHYRGGQTVDRVAIVAMEHRDSLRGGRDRGGLAADAGPARPRPGADRAIRAAARSGDVLRHARPR